MRNILSSISITRTTIIDTEFFEIVSKAVNNTMIGIVLDNIIKNINTKSIKIIPTIN